MYFLRTLHYTSQSCHVRLCAWMHQWHPLIMPEWHAEAADAAAAETDSPQVGGR